MTNGPDLLQALTDPQADAVRALATPRHFAAGEALFTLGDIADAIFLIQRGRVALALPMQVRDREQDMAVEERESGQTVGWSALIPPHRFTLTATALVDTDVLVIRRDALLAHFAAQPEVGYAVMRNVASVVGQRLEVVRAMWMREMQRVVKLSYA